MNYEFIGENIIGGHKYQNFTKGKLYDIRKRDVNEVYRAHEFYWVKSDTGEDIMVSNNSKRKYFKLTKKKI